MPLVQCRKCHTDILVFGFASPTPSRCPTCGARWPRAEPAPDLARPSLVKPPRFQRGDHVSG